MGKGYTIKWKKPFAKARFTPTMLNVMNQAATTVVDDLGSEHYTADTAMQGRAGQARVSIWPKPPDGLRHEAQNHEMARWAGVGRR